jgi:2-iminobutanoate/2-iminopropanoate deaminase
MTKLLKPSLSSRLRRRPRKHDSAIAERCKYMARKPLNPDTVSRPVSPTYSHAAIAEGKRLLFIAGQCGIDAEGNTVGDDIITQTRQAYENIRLILASVGATLDDVLHTDVFMVNVQRDLEGYLEVRREYFPQKPPPSTLVGVTCLVAPEYLVEVKAVAELDA